LLRRVVEATDHRPRVSVLERPHIGHQAEAPIC
jgi:hypothetical protein